ncbi:precorrin-2 dehydrogenase/sirohydrochlorin ferrochelatase family protein [Paenibacillus montanisoli]|uniref:precorrin-2 dehydrogenase n=1 Tax=Paenibacillus montanisoli TaxID=2081970 RepID=A0A328U5L0_9BACL|nr:bifunctional precorrin-2 dehydrogenase/sirohydrochlorin ferrochelatase [Paenibacillus montanisoli]RAP77849.1 hypothetical protein DL346_05175 [Paenibacillus montanisoli]
MTIYYPIMVKLRGKLCVVIGGGAVAARKVHGLLDGGADRVIVIAPAASAELQALADTRCIQLLQREYREGDLRDAFLVIAATNNRHVNEGIAATADKLGILVNAADLGEEGGFVTPSVVRRGELLLAVTTGGASPALAGIIGKELSRQFGTHFGEVVERLRLLRAHVMSNIPDSEQRAAILRQAAVEAMTIGDEGERRDTFPRERIEEWMMRLQQAAERSR